jgi:peptidyl-prolyl cis-trans isomerase SurA
MTTERLGMAGVRADGMARKTPRLLVFLALWASLALWAMMSVSAWGQQDSAALPAAAVSPAVSIPPAPIPKGAVVLDHVVAVINGSVILQSDVDEERAYAVLQPFMPYCSHSASTTRETPRNEPCSA